MILPEYTYEKVKGLFDSHGYPLNEKEVVPFACRNAIWTPDAWDDVLGIIHGQTVIAATGTTKPGKSALAREDVNEDGVFILRPNFYPNSLQKGKHKGKYDCLVQFGTKIFEGWRDDDQDGLFDINAVLWRNVRGLNFHSTRADKQVKRVGDFSEGCMVVEVWKEFQQMMEIVYGTDQALYSLALFQL